MRDTRKRLAQTWGDWLSEHEWDHWATLTFRPRRQRPEPGLGPAREISLVGPSPDYAHRAFARWIVDLSRRAGKQVRWFRGDEIGAYDRLHLHTLLGGTEVLSVETIRLSWLDGYAHVDVYRRDLGAAHYCSKYIGRELVDYDIG